MSKKLFYPSGKASQTLSTTPVSTSSRLPYEYDQMMGITQVGSGETEGFDEGTDLVYHDAAEDPNVLESVDNMREAGLSHGGSGSSSLRECIELVNNPHRNSPATCHSRATLESKSSPSQVMSPNVQESQPTAEQIAADSMPGNLSTLKKEPQVLAQQAKSEALTPKLESLTTEVKEEAVDFDVQGQGPDVLPEEMIGVTDNQPLDSEDSLSQEYVVNELGRLNAPQACAPLAEMNQNLEEGAVAPGDEESNVPMITQSRQGAVAPDSEVTREDNEAYAPQRSDRLRGRLRFPDPYLFISTIWIRHDPEASARAHGNPVDCLRDRAIAMEHNLDTLRTRVTQVADLRDAQGIREDHRAILARLNEVEECATVHTLREFMSKICRLEAMFIGDDGGVIFDAIRACNRRIDSLG